MFGPHNEAMLNIKCIHFFDLKSEKEILMLLGVKVKSVLLYEFIYLTKYISTIILILKVCSAIEHAEYMSLYNHAVYSPNLNMLSCIK